MIARVVCIYLTLLLSFSLWASEVPSDKDSKTVVVLIGPPASGKGTQAKFISEHLRLPIISIGNILRQETITSSKLGKQIKEQMKAGILIEDHIIFDILEKQLKRKKYKKGFILDGFPRTLSQALELGKMDIPITYVIKLDISDEEIVKRITGRRVHPESGRTYHIDFNPPKNPGLDDVTQEPLVHRDDDKPHIVWERLKNYNLQTKPVIIWFKRNSKQIGYEMIEIDGSQKIEDIQATLKEKLKK